MNLFLIGWIATATLLVLKLSGIAAIGWLTVFLPVISLYSLVAVILLITFIIFLRN